MRTQILSSLGSEIPKGIGKLEISSVLMTENSVMSTIALSSAAGAEDDVVSVFDCGVGARAAGCLCNAAPLPS